MQVLEHPEITCAERTGYPSWNQPMEIYCGECGQEIEGEIYEDEYYQFLCEKCLKFLHKKKW